MSRLRVAIASGALVLASCGEDPRVRSVSAEARGAVLFADSSLGREGNPVACADCHEAAAGGDGRRRPGRPLPGVVDREVFWGGQEEHLLDAVNECLYWFMGRGEPLTADDPLGVDLYAFLASLEGPADGATPQPFTLGDVVWPGLGDPARGEVTYTQACGWCHGERGSGSGRLSKSTPILPDDTLAKHALGEYTEDERRLVFVEKTRHGPFLGYGGTMPPISLETLGDAELADVFAFLEIP